MIKYFILFFMIVAAGANSQQYREYRAKNFSFRYNRQWLVFHQDRDNSRPNAFDLKGEEEQILVCNYKKLDSNNDNRLSDREIGNIKKVADPVLLIKVKVKKIAPDLPEKMSAKAIQDTQLFAFSTSFFEEVKQILIESGKWQPPKRQVIRVHRRKKKNNNHDSQAKKVKNPYADPTSQDNLKAIQKDLANFKYREDQTPERFRQALKIFKVSEYKHETLLGQKFLAVTFKFELGEIPNTHRTVFIGIVAKYLVAIVCFYPQGSLRSMMHIVKSLRINSR